jgi:hypothetical protein
MKYGSALQSFVLISHAVLTFFSTRLYIVIKANRNYNGGPKGLLSHVDQYECIFIAMVCLIAISLVHGLTDYGPKWIRRIHYLATLMAMFAMVAPIGLLAD